MIPNQVAAIFLDRDGTININNNYVYLIDNFYFIDQAIEAMIELQKMGFILIIITNQSGIARGFFTEQQFLYLTKWMLEYLKLNYVYIHAVYYCPHYIHGQIKMFQKKCFCRKPSPGMLFCAQEAFHINMNRSYIVGDSVSDMIAGKLAKVGTRVLISSEYDNQRKEKKNLSSVHYIIRNLACLPKIIKIHK